MNHTAVIRQDFYGYVIERVSHPPCRSGQESSTQSHSNFGLVEHLSQRESVSRDYETEFRSALPHICHATRARSLPIRDIAATCAGRLSAALSPLRRRGGKHIVEQGPCPSSMRP